jgi:tRNA pseudouridine55 synthase
LLFDKASGPSSNQALQRVKRLFGARKAGHAGTLDPLATGLLPLIFGEATKFASYLSDAHKTYEATVLLGVRTTSGDVTGEVVERLPVDVTPEKLAAVIGRFIGEIEQVPPMYSALKRSGVPLYKLARRGEVIARPPRAIRIDELNVLGLSEDELVIRVRCSKGTYIRVLAEDIGAALGCGATLRCLRRTSVGAFEIAQAMTFDDLEVLDEVERLQRLLPPDSGLGHIPAIDVAASAARSLYQGKKVESQPGVEGLVRVYAAESGAFLGLGHALQGRLRSVRLVNLPEPENILRDERANR